jgi:hypothetical protein
MYGDSIGRKAKVVQRSSTKNEDTIAQGFNAQTSDPQIPKQRISTSFFANVTPPQTPGIPKKNPLFFPPATSKTISAETSTSSVPDMRTPARVSPPEPTTEYEPYPPLPPQSSSGESGLKILEKLGTAPRALTLEEASDALIALRDQVRAFSTEHFGYEMTCKARREWPLADLQDKYPEFVANCAYVADGSQYGWRKLFTESYCRPHLVNGLLAHYLVEHVFKHTCFGLSEKELTDLDDNVLKKYIYYDGFVRSKQLALRISEIVHNKPIEGRALDAFTAVETLRTRIISTIGPVLPSCTDAQAAISTSLTQVLTHAQSLALSIRLTGRSGIILRFSFPDKHSEYQLGGAQSCLNASRVDATAHHAPEADHDQLRVKIPCWPTIIATVPSGPDMLDFKTDPSLKYRAGKPLPTYTGAPENNPGAFVTEVFMSPADVYCEWTPLAEPLEYPLRLTLWQAIAQAKRDRARALALARSQPRPPHRTATYILSATAIGGLAGVAITACTPSGRRLLLAMAKRLAASLHETDTNTTPTTTTTSSSSVKQISADTAAGVASKQSFWSRLGLPGPTRGFTLNSLRSLSRIKKARTIIKRTVVLETRGAPPHTAAAGIYDRLPFCSTPISDSPMTSAAGNWWDFPFVTVGVRGVTTGLGRRTTGVVLQPTVAQDESFASKVAQKTTDRDRPATRAKPFYAQWSPVGVLNRIPKVWNWYTARMP